MADDILEKIARYVVEEKEFGENAYRTARYCLADALGCAVLALQFPACKRLLGSLIPEVSIKNGCHVPGIKQMLDPVTASFNLGTMIRWLDFNDTWLAAEWGHPSDNIGALLPVAEYRSQAKPLIVHDLLTAIIKAYEIQGILALSTSYNRVGFDHVALVKIASTAVVTGLLGGGLQDVKNAVSQAFIDVGSLRTYRHAPNVGSRKSWAAGDAASRAVWLSLMTLRGEPGYETPLTAPQWGVEDVLFEGKSVELVRPLGSYVIENILFKIAFPAEFHAQTAVEAALFLHDQVKDRWNEIETITIETQEAAVRIIDKKGNLRNPADRDHCLQYMVAVPLLKGTLSAEDYEDQVANDPRIDALREKMRVVESKEYSRDYLDPEKRSIANAITIHFKGENSTAHKEVKYPIGHPRRRAEGIPLLIEKLKSNLSTHFVEKQVEALVAVFEDDARLNSLSIHEFVFLLS